MLPSVHFSSLTLSLFLLTALFLNPTFAHNKPSPTPAFIAPISTPDFVATARIRTVSFETVETGQTVVAPLTQTTASPSTGTRRPFGDPFTTRAFSNLSPQQQLTQALSNLSPCAISCLKNVPSVLSVLVSGQVNSLCDAVATDALKGCTSSCGEVAFLPILLGYCRSTSPSDAPLATTRAVVRVVSASKSSVRLDVMGTVLAVVSALLLI